MPTGKKDVTVTMGSRETVLSFINALNKEEFDAARIYADDKLKFDGVMGSRDGADAYFNDMKKMKFKYKIIKAFEEDDDVCLLYEIDMSGTDIFCCGWYRVRNGKIISLKVVFDPRPLLEKSRKN